MMEGKQSSVIPYCSKLLLKNSFWDYDYGWAYYARLFFCPDECPVAGIQAEATMANLRIFAGREMVAIADIT